jgi:hypothetical protein
MPEKIRRGLERILPSRLAHYSRREGKMQGGTEARAKVGEDCFKASRRVRRTVGSNKVTISLAKPLKCWKFPFS